MKKKDEKFKEVSAFSKRPILCRAPTLLSFYTLLISLGGLTIYKTNNNFTPLICTFEIVALCAVTITFIKLRSEFNRSPFCKLQQYIFDNKLYEDEIKSAGCDREGYPRQKRVITNSAYFSYLIKNDELIIRAWKKADKFSDRANAQDSMLSALFGIELYKKYDDVQFCDYIFELVPDKRLTSTTRKSLKNMWVQMTEKIGWTLGIPAHLLIVGGTGSGKTRLVTMLILDYLKFGSELLIIDPKNCDLAMIGRMIDVRLSIQISNVATDENKIAQLLRRANEEMEQRYEKWFSDEKNFGKTWHEIPNAKPLIVIIDEFSALSAVASPKTMKEINGYLFNLILKGRQAGIEVVMLMQRPDANILSGNIRDQFGVRIGLGNLTNDGRKMLFGITDNDFKTVQTVGGGFILIDGNEQTNKPVYFETPLLSGGMDYLDELYLAIEENKRLNQISRLK